MNYQGSFEQPLCHASNNMQSNSMQRVHCGALPSQITDKADHMAPHSQKVWCPVTWPSKS